jgi:hypothetical protein
MVSFCFCFTRRWSRLDLRRIPRLRKESMAAGPSVADLVSEALFVLPAERLREALSRLPAGVLWHACLPGMDPDLTLRTLGDGADEALRQAARAWAGGDGGMLAMNAGLPFTVDTGGDLEPLGSALLDDARALMAQSPAFGAVAVPPGPVSWTVEVVHRTRAEWMDRVLACLDHAAAEAFAGRQPDTVLALLRCPEHDLSGIVPLADADARLRFVEALADAGDPPDQMARFRRSPWRRGAAAGLAAAVEAALAAPGAGETGHSPDGWPAWWHSAGAEPSAILAAVPPAVLAEAADVRSAPLPGSA